MRALQVIFLLGCVGWILMWTGSALNAWAQREHRRIIKAALDREAQRAYQATRGVTRP